MKLGLLFLLLLISGLSKGLADTLKSTTNALGHTFTTKQSQALNSMTLKIWIPESVDSQPLPLLVVLDSQRYFNYAISMHHMIEDYGWAPQFAILGLDTSENRWSMLSGQRHEILETLEKQVFPYVESKFPVSGERILFGWEAAGGFTLRTVIDNPTLFSGYIAASPSPLFGEYFPTLREDYETMLKAMTASTANTHLYVAQGRYDYPQYLGIDQLKSGLDSAQTAKLRYSFETIEDATHSNLGFETLMRGVRDYFYYYDTPQFNSLQAFENKGGHQYLDKYFKQQALQYGFKQEELNQNRFELLRKLSFIALMDDDIEGFKQFFARLENTDFLDRSHAPHLYRYGLFSLQKNDILKAEKLFNYIKQRAPDNALPINGLGLVAEARGDNQKAIELFAKAVELAEQQDDYRLDEYLSNLKRIQ